MGETVSDVLSEDDTELSISQDHTGDYLTPFGPRRFEPGDYSARERGLRYEVTSKSNPTWFMHGENED